MDIVKFEIGKKYFFGKRGYLAGGHWNYGTYGYYTVIARTAKFITIQSSDQHCVDEDTQEMAYEIARAKIYIDTRGNQEMSTVKSGLFAKNIHEDNPDNNDVSKW